MYIKKDKTIDFSDLLDFKKKSPDEFIKENKSDQEKKKENTLSTKINLFFFLDRFLGRFLGQERVFFIFRVVITTLLYSLFSLFSFLFSPKCSKF